MPTEDGSWTTPIDVWGMKPRNGSCKKLQNIGDGVLKDSQRGGIPMEWVGYILVSLIP